ncbi:MAG: Na+:solute symporter [Phycisphaerales bacterium]|nr:Na+:solute symporter [Phycisphaerales bacterium]
MHFENVDWVVLGISVVVIFAPALFFARRASRDTTEFFASGRSAPWWLVGTSMVATTFATDTPGFVTQVVREQGIFGNWIWWAFLFSGMATVFIYARLWRRAGLLTDLEFYEIRYSGRPAALVRGFRAVYLGLIFNCFIMANVTLAAVKIAGVLLGVPAWKTIAVAIVLCSAISAVSGLWGVLVSDLIQFGLALTGSVAAAYYALAHPAVGGLDGLIRQIEPVRLRMLPILTGAEAAQVEYKGAFGLLAGILLIPVLLQWWSTWYPGAEPGGGTYIAQRILASKDERHAAGATLWFNVAHYALRPWPWILVGLASIIVFPGPQALQAAFPGMDPRLIKGDMAYPAMLTFLPAGVLGLVAASLLAAYVSTMSTQLNLGASYLVNDFYRRFIKPSADQKHYLLVSRLLTILLMVFSGLLVFVLESAKEGFSVILTIGAGTGLIYLLRWFWWRINAWSEIAAMVSSFLVSMAILLYNKQTDGAIDGDAALICTVAVTSIVWIIATLFTRPESRENAPPRSSGTRSRRGRAGGRSARRGNCPRRPTVWPAASPAGCSDAPQCIRCSLAAGACCSSGPRRALPCWRSPS